MQYQKNITSLENIYVSEIIIMRLIIKHHNNLLTGYFDIKKSKKKFEKKY